MSGGKCENYSMGGCINDMFTYLHINRGMC